MINPITLESVTSAFNDWRTQRTSLGARIPLSLQQQAIQLLQTHSTSQVIKALNINHKMLKRWQQQQADTPACEFINLTRDPLADHASLQVILHNAQGGKMTITGITLSQLTTLTTAFSTSMGESR